VAEGYLALYFAETCGVCRLQAQPVCGFQRSPFQALNS
jgi:hypothetical protein